MERGKKTGIILRQFRKKNKRAINKDLFTEFFYLNKERRVVEFLLNDSSIVLEDFFKKFLPSEFREFVKVKVLNDVEEEIRTWYIEEENLVLIIEINWGSKKQEISIELNIENFMITAISEKGQVIREVDYVMLNDYIISFLTRQARNLAETFDVLIKKNVSKQKN